MKQNLKRRSILLLCTLLLFINSSYIAYAEERPIYVGDIINLEIENSGLDLSEVEAAFKDFEVMSIYENDESITLKIRTFDVGEKVVQIGNQTVSIVVVSTLDDHDKTDIYDEMNPLVVSNNDVYLLLACAITGLLIIVLTAVKWAKNREKKVKDKTGYEEFVESVEENRMSDGQVLTRWTVTLKVYIESVYEIRAIGKTTEELSKELEQACSKDIYELLVQWLYDTDSHKYKMSAVSADVEETLYKRLLEIGQRLHMIEVQREAIAS
ncbi:hypothetical protein EZV73_00640 [Acidaminobacter sp. JC074]|uniref:hypothetical protein n=1 Tax=Acidaminobacter sp. JC074 TaxID=2530199 RepID=UPI001F10CA2D|nr:hypothetical protein [Acidaminobacter sp. JC074]MCH4886047.1 hypothetical protein [Acidaminobacter sp. JC074]